MDDYKKANYIVINTCMIRQSAENRVYGFVNNLSKIKAKNSKLKIIVTGCMTGAAFREKSGAFLKRLHDIMPDVDEFMPVEEVGFDFAPVRINKTTALVPISNGCNNFCTYCIVPFTRGREVSRPYADIIRECKDLKKKGFKKIILLGQNVNSYGADLVLGEKSAQLLRDIPHKKYFSGKNDSAKKNIKNSLIDIPAHNALKFSLDNGKVVKPIYVKHLGRYRIPTLFPHLLEDVARMKFEQIDFISSNPWDFSDELIDVVAQNTNISRIIHLPVQSGDNAVLKRMNRWYTREEYSALIKKLRSAIPKVQFTTDIIVGFCGETEKEYKNTVTLCKKVGFLKAYIALYSPRPMTSSGKAFKDDISFPVKKRRWEELDALINKSQLDKNAGIHTYFVKKRKRKEHAL